MLKRREGSVQVNTTVNKNGSIMGQSVTGIVTAEPGTYALTFAIVATVTETAKPQQIRERVAAVVK